jgi:hypothetical protein
MSLKGATVVLTMRLQGDQLNYGKYDYREKTTTGSILEADQRLFITKKAKYSDCNKVVHLGEAFTGYALSEDGRPKKDHNFKAYTFWRKMTDAEKIAYHVSKYVGDANGIGFTFNIIDP